MSRPIPIAEWDELEIVQDQADFLLERYVEDSENEVIDLEDLKQKCFESASEDIDLFDAESDRVENNLSVAMETKQARLGRREEDWYWLIRGADMGWQRLAGRKYVKANDGRELLKAILPATDCTWSIYHWQNGMRMRNAHHDAPTGEYYTIRPISETTYKRIMGEL